MRKYTCELVTQIVYTITDITKNRNKCKNKTKTEKPDDLEISPERIFGEIFENICRRMSSTTCFQFWTPVSCNSQFDRKAKTPKCLIIHIIPIFICNGKENQRFVVYFCNCFDIFSPQIVSPIGKSNQAITHCSAHSYQFTPPPPQQQHQQHQM